MLLLETFLYLPPKFVSTCKQVGLFAQVVTCLLITLLQDQRLCQIHIGGQGIVRAGFDLCHVVNLHLEDARHVSSICLRLGDPLLNCGHVLRRRILGLLVLQLLRLSLPRGSQCLHMLRHIRGTLLEGGLKLRQGSEHATPDQALLVEFGLIQLAIGDVVDELIHHLAVPEEFGPLKPNSRARTAQKPLPSRGLSGQRLCLLHTHLLCTSSLQASLCSCTAALNLVASSQAVATFTAVAKASR